MLQGYLISRPQPAAGFEQFALAAADVPETA
jgi:EAL domain-containing protein (putative c-di-GMP-specific phosphodiesterase class I)